MDRRQLIAVVATVPISLSGCTRWVFPNDVNDDPPQPVVIREAALERTNVGTDEEAVLVRGVAERVTDRELSFVEIRARFYNDEGELLDSTVEVIEDVTKGTMWEFTIEFPHYGERAAEVTDYELDVITSL